MFSLIAVAFGGLALATGIALHYLQLRLERLDGPASRRRTRSRSVGHPVLPCCSRASPEGDSLPNPHASAVELRRPTWTRSLPLRMCVPGAGRT